ncbi:MAG: RadC family protein [Nanobdellota archaeon]
MRIKEISSQNRPRERMLKEGEKALSDAELLAIILVKGTRKENAIDISNKLLSEYNIHNLSDITINELKKIQGIGLVKALQIKAIIELNKRISKTCKKIKKINRPKDVFNYFKDALTPLKQEHFFVLSLDTKNQIVSEKILSIGTLNAAVVHPREIFKEAIKNSANSFILVHNHPSGDPEPSEEDLQVSKEIMEASKFMGIRMLDHVIIGKETFWSYKEN